MLDIKLIRSDLKRVAKYLAVRGHDFPSSRFSQLDKRRKAADVRLQALQADRKNVSKEIGKLVAQGKSVDEAKIEIEAKLRSISRDLKFAQAESKNIQDELHSILVCTPNIPDARVPSGKDDSKNVEIYKWGKQRTFRFLPKDHISIGENLRMLDLEGAVKLTGARFSVLKGQLAKLHRVLAQYMLDLHTQEHGYTEIYVPFLVNEDSMFGTGQLPKFASDSFQLSGEQPFYLVPTAEVPMTNMIRDVLLEASELPESGQKWVAHTPCFRSEAGSYGKDARGLIRQHQFEKVELVHFSRPDHSDDALDTLTGHAEAVLRGLDLPYRKVMLCGGDLGFSAKITFDLEVWLPGQARYREISSCSNFGDYQARRMRARWRNPKTGKPEPLHTLNGSGLAVGRTLVAVLENYQRADGGIDIPLALVPYMGTRTIAV